MMTVEALIEALRQYPSDMKVLVRSYELGYDSIKKLEIKTLVNNPTDHNYEGNFITWTAREGLATREGWLQDKIDIDESEREARFDGLLLVGDSRSGFLSD